MDQLEQTPGGEGTKITRLVFMHEIQRVRYLIQSYFRARLLKIEKYVLNILGDEELKKRLSPRELQYANVRTPYQPRGGLFTCVMCQGHFKLFVPFQLCARLHIENLSCPGMHLVLKGIIVFSIVC